MNKKVYLPLLLLTAAIFTIPLYKPLIVNLYKKLNTNTSATSKTAIHKGSPSENIYKVYMKDGEVILDK
jgi:hypothetical protein